MRLAGTRAVEYRPHREQRRSTRALHDATQAVGVGIELSGSHGLLHRRQQFRVGRNLVLLHGRGIERERRTGVEIAVEHQERVDVEPHQRGGVE